MKFTHDLDIHLGWTKTLQIPSDFEEVKHLGKCAIDGDMFAAYNEQGEIEIFKGTMEEQTLKTNTWYKANLGLFVYRTGNIGNYGFNSEKESNDCVCRNPNVWKEATDEEIEDALIKVAKRKGFKDIDKLTLKDFDGAVYPKGVFTCRGNNFYYYDNMLTLDGLTIFNKGDWIENLEWAEILEEELSIEERLKRIEEKLNI